MLRNLWSPSSARRRAAAETTPDSEDPRVSHDAALRELYELRRAQRSWRRREHEMQAAQEAVVSELTDKLHRETRLLEEVNRMRRPEYRPHAIALRLILETLSPAPQFLDPSLSAGPESPWCRVMRTKKALVLVCKAWRKAALPLLYEDVVLRRSGQIYALARTIRSDPVSYGPMIKKIRFSCYVLQNQECIARDDLVYILQKCPELVSLSFSTTFLPMVDYTWTTDSPNSSQNSAPAEPDALMVEVLKKGTDLTHLEYHRVFRLEDTFIYSPLPLLQACSNLVSLSIFVPPADAPTVALKDVCFNKLETLYLHPDATRDDCSSTLSSLCTWEMPRLRALHFRPYINPRKLPMKLAKFVRTYGPRLRVLDLGCHFFSDAHDAGALAALTAVLDEIRGAVAANAAFAHLVVPWRFHRLHVLDSPLAAAEIAHVDVWASVAERRLADALARGAGALLWRRVRLFDQGLSSLLDLPHLLAPGAGAECHDVCGLRVVQRGGAVIREGGVWDALAPAQATVYTVAAGAPDDAPSSDSEYVPPSARGTDASAGDDESSEERDEHDYDSDDGGGDDDDVSSQSTDDSQTSDPPVTLEEALWIFSQSLE